MRARVVLESPARPSGFLGSAWRGLAGAEMRRLCCPADGKADCAQCRARNRCRYFRLFEGGSSLPGLSEVPRGYILYPPSSEGTAEQELYVTLLGRCARQSPAMFAALLRGQESGLGADRVRYRVLKFEELLPAGPPETIRTDPWSLRTGSGTGFSGDTGCRRVFASE